MQFPKREAEIVRLAQDVSRGLAANPEVFPAPPAVVATIDEAIVAYNSAREASLASQATAQADTAAKQEALEALIGVVRSDLKYAESVANGDEARLQLVGWGGPRKASRKAVPGQVITLEVRQEGAGWVALAWKPPFDGGAVSAYRVQRRRRENGGWTDVGTSVDRAVRLEGQDPGAELEHRVIGVNAAGEGPPSNVVRVVL